MAWKRDVEIHRERLASLLEVAGGAKRGLIVTHNDPDPDAIGSAVGLAELLQRRLRARVTLAYSGIIGRAENRAMVEELGIALQPLDSLNCDDYDLIALVDSQPGAGNQPFRDPCRVQVVVDHHRLLERTRSVPFWDVREGYGATSTIVVWYLRDARVRLTARVATALFYGIKSDTLGLARATHQDDARAYLHLQGYVDSTALVRIKNASVSPEYFRVLDRALHQTSLHDHVMVARVGEMRYPDMAAEVADMLHRLRDTIVVLAIGQYADDVIVSARSSERGIPLDELVQKVIGEDGSAGGHGFMAAGRVPASLAGTAEDTERELVKRFARALGVDERRGKPLLPSPA